MEVPTVFCAAGHYRSQHSYTVIQTMSCEAYAVLTNKFFSTLLGSEQTEKTGGQKPGIHTELTWSLLALLIKLPNSQPSLLKQLLAFWKGWM